MSGEIKTIIRRADPKRLGPNRHERATKLFDAHEPTDHDTFEDYESWCFESGLAVRLSRNRFNAAKEKEKASK